MNRWGIPITIVNFKIPPCNIYNLELHVKKFLNAKFLSLDMRILNLFAKIPTTFGTKFKFNEMTI